MTNDFREQYLPYSTIRENRVGTPPDNILLAGDSYKFSHWLQYPPKTQYVSSYIESRGSAFPFRNAYDKLIGSEPEVVHFGLQMFLPELLKPITPEHVEYAADVAGKHGVPFNKEGWLALSKLGYMPLSIQALPEGTPVPLHTPQVQVCNTHPDFYWLTSYIETALLRAVWYPSTVATLSREIKKDIWKFLQETCDDPAAQISFKLHDFGCRGASSLESAKIGGMAHLVNFMGTDTVPALIAAREHYEADMAGFSVSAAEHSTITSWGEDHEEDAYRNMLKQFGKPGAIVSVVSDSWDIYNAVSNIWGGSLRKEVIESGAILVVRPDSGDPVQVTWKVIELLAAKFGCTVNSKGYKVLHPSVRIIQGDGVGKETIHKILENYRDNGWSAENITFGMGGALLQQVNRDSLKYAMKCNAMSFGEGWVPVSKKPKTDAGKASKAGRLAVTKDTMDRTYTTIHESDVGIKGMRNVLTEVFKDGNIKKLWTLDEVRYNAKI
jgi:nicotinamide phosphoribosyltransferase